eukprot:COSAG06_NODE_62827_length_264_cov_0.612121_1_plen_64_part_10
MTIIYPWRIISLAEGRLRLPDALSIEGSQRRRAADRSWAGAKNASVSPFYTLPPQPPPLSSLMY